MALLNDWLRVLRDVVPYFDVKSMSSVLLPVTSTLLGLVYAGLTYWLQSGIERLEFSKDLLEPMLTRQGKVIMDLLVGASLVSLFGMFELTSLMVITFWIMLFVLIVDCLRAIAEQGYIETLFSSKYIPHNYGPLCTWFRQLCNAGIKGWAKPALVIFFTVLMPIIVDLDKRPRMFVSNRGIGLFLLSSTALSLFEIRGLILEAFSAKKLIEKRLAKVNEDAKSHLDPPKERWTTQQIKVTTLVLQECLASIGVKPWHRHKHLVGERWESRSLHDTPVLEADPRVNEDGSLHLNVVIPYLADDAATRNHVFQWTQRILSTIATSRSSATPISISFFRIEEGEEQYRMFIGMFRTPASEVVKLVEEALSPEEFCRKLPGRYLNKGVW